MNVLTFDTELGSVTIELLNNDFVEQWSQHVVQMAQHYSYRPRRSMWPYVRSDKTGHAEVIDRLLDTVDLINRSEFLSPLPEAIDRFDLLLLNLETQKVLNRLHRYCVTATNTRDRWHGNQAQWSWLDYDHQQFDYLINLLNQTIHEFEEYVDTPRRKKYWCALDTTEFLVVASQYDNVDVYHDNVDVTIDPKMQQHLALGGADVWIKKDILGKDYITAFVDHDSAAESDVQCPPMYSGGFVIDYAGRDTIYQSQDFASWLGQTPAAFHGNYPVGNVIAGKQFAKHCTTIQNIKIGRS